MDLWKNGYPRKDQGRGADLPASFSFALLVISNDMVLYQQTTTVH